MSAFLRLCFLSTFFLMSSTAWATSHDADGDFWPDENDNCPTVYNIGQEDVDCDGIGDVCDPDNSDGNCTVDVDGDGVEDMTDNCPSTYNPFQNDSDCDGFGDACDSVDNMLCVIPDGDNDGIPDADDACPTEDATGNDTNGDGCIDVVEDIEAIIDTLPGIEESAQTQIIKKANSAIFALDNGDSQLALNQLKALTNYVDAQSGKKIDAETAGIINRFVEGTLNGI